MDSSRIQNLGPCDGKGRGAEVPQGPGCPPTPPRPQHVEHMPAGVPHPSPPRHPRPARTPTRGPTGGASPDLQLQAPPPPPLAPFSKWGGSSQEGKVCCHLLAIRQRGGTHVHLRGGEEGEGERRGGGSGEGREAGKAGKQVLKERADHDSDGPRLRFQLCVLRQITQHLWASFPVWQELEYHDAC